MRGRWLPAFSNYECHYTIALRRHSLLPRRSAMSLKPSYSNPTPFRIVVLRAVVAIVVASHIELPRDPFVTSFLLRVMRPPDSAACPPVGQATETHQPVLWRAPKRHDKALRVVLSFVNGVAHHSAASCGGGREQRHNISARSRVPQ